MSNYFPIGVNILNKFEVVIAILNVIIIISSTYNIFSILIVLYILDFTLVLVQKCICFNQYLSAAKFLIFCLLFQYFLVSSLLDKTIFIFLFITKKDFKNFLYPLIERIEYLYAFIFSYFNLFCFLFSFNHIMI